MAMKRTLMLVGAVLVALSVLAAGDASARIIEKNYHEQFDVQQGHRLVLVHGDGDVVITPWDRDVLDVDVQYRTRVTKIGLGKDPDFEVEFRQSGDEVLVTGHETSAVTVGFFSREEYEYVFTIKAPAWLELELDGADGDVSIEGWRGEIDADLEDGDVRLLDLDVPRARFGLEDGEFRAEGLRGDLQVELDDGDVVLEDCHARCRIELADGDIRIKNSEGTYDCEADDGEIELIRIRLEAGEIRTEDGDVDLELLRVDRLDLDVTTDGGDIAVQLEEGTSATFDIEADDGGIRLDLPGADVDEDDDRASGRIGDGSGTIRIRTEDGRVSLRTSG
jgi:DUF4097 and DUF4098 domain-containing protein YvlB